jgi:HK97 family phage major capsid protein
MSPNNDDMELIRKLRAEWRTNWGELFEEQNKKGFVDPLAREKLGKIEAELNTKTDAQIATQSKRIDDQQKLIDDQGAKLKAFGERLSRPPGSLGGDDGPLVKTIGQKFIETDNFKNAQFSGRFQIQAGLTKTRITDIMRKAVGTIVTGGATTITPPVGAYPIFPRRMGLVPQQFTPLTMRDLVDVIPIDGTNAVEYVTEDWVNNADYQILEGDKKPQSGVTYTDHTAVVRTIAHYVKVSRQMAADVSFIIATIENRLALFVLLKEDKEILYGDNSAGHLWGIMPQATPATVYYPGPAPATDTAIDQLNAAETYIESQFYFPTAFVMNPLTWAKIEGFKTTFGTYLLQGVPFSDGIQRMWGLPVLTTPNMAVNDYLCGAFPGTSALFDRETVNVEMAFQNEDDFIRNLITIRAEERVAFAVYVPKAYAKGPLVTPLMLEQPANGGGALNAPEASIKTGGAERVAAPVRK